MPTVKVPADVELADRLAFGLTAKQLAILAATAVAAYGSFLLLAPPLPAPLAIAAIGLVAAGGVTLALVRHDGLAGDQLALAVARFALAPKRQLLAPDALPAAFPRAPRQPRVAPLDIPIRRIRRSGLIETADGGHCRLLTAQATSFALRSPHEQAAFVDAFARFLNALSEPLQIDVRSEPIALTVQATQLEAAAAAHPEPLRRAALDHAGYLRALPHQRPLHRRRIVLVLRTQERRAEVAEATLERRTAEAHELLAAAGVALAPLDGEHAAQLLAATLDPPGPPAGSHLEGVIHAQPAPPARTDDAAAEQGAARAGRARPTRRPRPRRQPLAADARDQRLPA